MSRPDAKIGGSSKLLLHDEGIMSPPPQPSSLFALLPAFARARRSSRTLGLSVLLTACVVYLLLTTSAPSGNRSGGLLPAISLPSQQQQQQQQYAGGSSRPSNYDYLHLTTSVEEWSAHMAHTLGSVFERNAPLGPSEAAPPPEWKRQNAIFQQKWNGTETAGLWDTIRLEPPALLLRMRDAHARFLEDAARTMPEYIAPPPPPAVEGGGGSGGGRGSSSSSQQRRGIVTVGGGKFFPPLLVSLRVLRRTGTALPVEVFVPRRDYEADLELCEAVLPALGARCRVFPEVPPLAPLDSFQLKVFAVLFSAFDEVLLLDADDFPVRDVAPLFAAPPYEGAGLVVWPDFWGTAVSPLYYLVSGQAPVAVAARPKSETGQLLVDKRRHWRTLLLAAYYNYFPDVYYPLLCQGCIGCGDSETILPAADLLGLPYYYVKTPPLHVGHRMTDGGIQGHVIAQYDAADDYEATSSSSTTAAPADLFATLEERLPLRDRARPLFMHASFPKWDAYVLLDHVSQWSDMTRDTQGRPAAAFQEPREDAARIRGVERMAWEEAAWAVCTHGDQVAHWAQQAGKPRPDGVCARLTAYIRDVLDGEVGAGLGLGPGDVLTPAQE